MCNERIVLDTSDSEAANMVAKVCREIRTWSREVLG